MSKIKKLFYILIICFFSFKNAYSNEEISNLKLYTATSIDQINNSLMDFLTNHNPEQTLTIVSLNQIITIDEKELYSNNENYKSIISRALKKVRRPNAEYFSELLLTEYNNKISSPKFAEFFSNIQELNAPFLVTTDNVSGSFNKIPYLEVWTWKYLLDNNIDLSKNPLGMQQIIFKSTHKKIKGTYPTFYRGLLSANSEMGKNSIQSVIFYLLDEHLKWKPDVVFVIDSNENYIKSIANQFRYIKPSIKVIGFVHDTQKKFNNDISAQNALKFWNNFATKLNSVTRKEFKNAKGNPYEE